MIRQSGEVENQMVSVERVQEFVHTPPEAPLDAGLGSDTDSVHSSWYERSIAAASASLLPSLLTP